MFLRILILLTLFSLPLYAVRFTVSGLPTTLLEIILLITFITWTLQELKSIQKTVSVKRLPILRSWYIQTFRKLDSLRFPITLFLIASVIAVFSAPALAPALGHWRAYILEPILFALIVINTIKTERDRSLVIYALAASLVIPITIALYQQITGNLIPNEFWADAATRRVTSVYGYPNALGLYTVPVLVLIFGECVRLFNRHCDPALAGEAIPHPHIDRHVGVRLLAMPLLFVVALPATVFTRSKGALIALTVGVAVFFFLNAKKKLLTAGIIAALAVAGFFAFKGSINLRGISTVQGGDSVSVRLTQYHETWEMLKDNPILGAGLRGYQTAMIPYHQQKYIEIFMYPHNIFLTVWSELGLLGLIAFLWILFSFFKYQYANHRRKSGESKFSHEDSLSLSEGWAQRKASQRLGGHGSANEAESQAESRAAIPSQGELTASFRATILSEGASSAEENLPLIASTAAAMIALLIHGLVDVPYFKNDLAVLFWILISFSVISLHRQNEKNMLQ